MPKGTCSVAECDRPVKARSWCHAHYMWWYKNRAEPTAPVRAWGRSRIETCSVSGCDLPFAANAYCAPHNKRVAKYGTPGPAEIRPRSVGDAADYALVHQRLKKSVGPASDFACVSCGLSALHWAYQHDDPDERLDEKTGLNYSVNLDHYRPMCVPCHWRLDEALGRRHVAANRRF